MRNFKFIAGIILQLMLTIAVFIVGWSMSTTSINLNHVNKLSAIVSSIDQQVVNSGRATTNVKSLIIHLINVDDGFWIYRSNGNYQSLINDVKVGGTVTIYYGKYRGSNNFYTVYQLESQTDVLYSKDEFERKEKLAGRFVALPGSLVLLGMVIYRIRKRWFIPPHQSI